MLDLLTSPGDLLRWGHPDATAALADFESVLMNLAAESGERRRRR
jgi:hypothetical protein